MIEATARAVRTRGLREEVCLNLNFIFLANVPCTFTCRPIYPSSRKKQTKNHKKYRVGMTLGHVQPIAGRLPIG